MIKMFCGVFQTSGFFNKRVECREQISMNIQNGILFHLIIAVFVFCTNSHSVEIQHEELPKPPADKNVSWLVHRCGWGDNPTDGSRMSPDYYDCYIHDYSAGIAAEYDKLREMDKNAVFIQSFGDVRTLASGAASSGMGYAFSESLSPIVLPDLNIKTPEDCAAYISRHLALDKEFPGYFRINGNPVVCVFDTSAFTPEEWSKILQIIRNAYPEKNLRFIAQRSVYDVTRMKDPSGYMKHLLSAFDGIMFWGGPLDVKQENLKLAREAETALGQKKMIFWALTNGYWRPEKGIFRNPCNTGDWRDELKFCFESELDALIVESWNDLEENTEVLPTRETGGIFFELLRYYAEISNHRTYVAEYPGLIVTHSREILLGEDAKIEIITLPVKSRSVFSLQVEDEAGRLIYRSPDQKASCNCAEVFTFSLPTSSLQKSQVLFYTITVDGKCFNSETWTQICRSKLNTPWIQGVVLSRVIQMPEPGLVLYPAENRADVRLQHDIPWVNVDLYCNNQVIWSLDADRLNRQFDWNHGPVSLEFDFQRPRTYVDENNDRSAVMTVANGSFVRAYDKFGNSLVAAPDRITWSAPPVFSRKFHVKLLADANEDTLFTVDFPKLKQTIRFTLKDLGSRNFLEKMYSPHGRVWIRRTDHPVVWKTNPAGLGTNVQETVALGSADSRVKKEYFLWAVDQAGHTYRSRPTTVYSYCEKKKTKQWFWDENIGKRFAASVAGNEQMSLVWSFNDPSSRIYEDEHGFGIWLRLGGGMWRAGHFEPDAMPKVIKEQDGSALQFDGNDYVQMDSGAFPQGAFEMSLRIRPERTGAERQILFFCESNLTLFLSPDGRIGIELRELQGLSSDQKLNHPDVLPLHKWSNITLSYDYQELTLGVNGKKVSVPLAKGPVHRPAKEGYFGANVYGAHDTYASQFFTGDMDDVVIQCGVKQ